MLGSVVDRLADCGTRSEFIVAGCTSTLQVLDVGINRPFKSYMAQSFNDHMIADGGKPTRPIVATWISQSWNAITKDTITNTWRHIGIHSNF